jgi:hypothetical protein
MGTQRCIKCDSNINWLDLKNNKKYNFPKKKKMGSTTFYVDHACIFCF